MRDHAPLVLGHRGVPSEAPENTLHSFQRAMELGADGVELDVQPAADGTAVVIHDPTLDRTTDGCGAVADRAWGELRALRAGGEPLPRLEQAVSWAAAHRAYLNVEVKSSGAEPASVDAVRSAGLMERTFFSSFRPEVVVALRKHAPDGEVFFLTERWDDEVRAGVLEMGVRGVCLHHSLATPEALGWLQTSGLDAVVWTVDEPARLRELLAQPLRAVISNHPDRAVAARRAALAAG